MNGPLASHLTTTRFDGLPMRPELKQAIANAGFEYCTPIQASALPAMLDGRDVAGQAQTGTGKTAAFLLATMQRLMTSGAGPAEPGAPRAVILAPTRELAIQIHKDAEGLRHETGLGLALAYGGIDYDKQRVQFDEPVDILIGTPGRIIDYFKQKVYHFRNVEVAVLDEADRMFDLGFIKDIRFLLRRMPPPGERLTLLFSATLSLRVHELAYEHMNAPETVEVSPDKVTADQVTQTLYHVESNRKHSLLVGLLKRERPERSLLFVNTKHGAEKLESCLNGNGFPARRLTGDVHQRQRQSRIAQFTRGEINCLVATDVAARGLHVPGVTHVINVDLPQNAEDYVHRIGRTARAGAQGKAISLACERYVYSLMEIEEYIGQPIASSMPEEELFVNLAPSKAVATERADGPSRHGGDKGPSRRRRRRRAESASGS